MSSQIWHSETVDDTMTLWARITRSTGQFARLFAHFAHSLARGTVNDWMAILSMFFSFLDHIAPVRVVLRVSSNFQQMS